MIAYFGMGCYTSKFLHPNKGVGIAGKLSHAALEFARDNGLKVVARCPFIATYMRRHPELLQPDASPLGR